MKRRSNSGSMMLHRAWWTTRSRNGVAILDTYRKSEDLINIGAYVTGSSSKIDYAIEMIDKVNAYLRQDIEETFTFEDSIQQLGNLFY